MMQVNDCDHVHPGCFLGVDEDDEQSLSMIQMLLDQC